MTEEVKVLSREDLDKITPQERVYEIVEVPGYGNVRIRSLTAGEGLGVLDALQQEGTKGMFLVFAMTAVDAAGALLYEGPAEEQIGLLKMKPLAMLSLVQDRVLKMNKLGQYAQSSIDEAKNA